MPYWDGVLEEKFEEDLTGLAELKGKTIIKIGWIRERVEGGLAIDYKDEEDSGFLTGLPYKIKRIVLGFNDLGMWTAWQGFKGKQNLEDLLKKKIKKVVESKDTVVLDSSVKIIDDPLKRCYRITYRKKELLVLTLSEIKIMPEWARKYFQTKPEERTAKMKEDFITFLWQYPY
jgi:hypothetical protein